MTEQNPIWRAPGVEPPENLKDNGWQPGMKPSAEHMNWLFYELSKAAQEAGVTVEDLLTSNSATSALSAKQGKVLNTNLITLQGEVTQHMEQKATLNAYGHVQHATLDVSLSTTWTGTSTPYTQSVIANGILETDNPIISPIYSEDFEIAVAQKEAWSMVSKAVTINNGIVFYCFEDKPTVPIPIQIKVVR